MNLSNLAVAEISIDTMEEKLPITASIVGTQGIDYIQNPNPENTVIKQPPHASIVGTTRTVISITQSDRIILDKLLLNHNKNAKRKLNLITLTDLIVAGEIIKELHTANFTKFSEKIRISQNSYNTLLELTISMKEKGYTKISARKLLSILIAQYSSKIL